VVDLLVLEFRGLAQEVADLLYDFEFVVELRRNYVFEEQSEVVHDLLVLLVEDGIVVLRLQLKPFPW
jgi:hypothetical protein